MIKKTSLSKYQQLELSLYLLIVATFVTILNRIEEKRVPLAWFNTDSTRNTQLIKSPNSKKFKWGKNAFPSVYSIDFAL